MTWAQKWFCQECNISGIVQYEKNHGAWSVVMKLHDDHQEKSPECPVGYRMLRIEGKPFEVIE